jgi:hypothetical protein
MLPDEQPSPEQIAIWRGMSSEQRLNLLELLDDSVRKMKAAGFHAQHPDWPEKRVSAEVRQIISRIDPEFYFEGILPMFNVCGERFDRQMMVEWLRQRGIGTELREVSS